MDDLVTYALLTASVFFFVVALGLLVRYRQVSQKIAASTDLGRDLWQALDQRLQKQDERILDMMGRFEVIQYRATEHSVSPTPLVVPGPIHTDKPVARVEDSPTLVSRRISVTSLDPTEVAVIKLLGEKARSSVEIKGLVGKSREHTARLMKSLFDRELVTRNDSTRPFVYQLSDAGRRYLSAS